MAGGQNKGEEEDRPRNISIYVGGREDIYDRLGALSEISRGLSESSLIGAALEVMLPVFEKEIPVKRQFKVEVTVDDKKTYKPVLIRE